MRHLARIVGPAIATACLVLACSSEGKVGEDCDTSGKIDGECESGGVCGKNGAGNLVCLTVCTEQAQCASNEDCNGVDGTSVKGCRPK